MSLYQQPCRCRTGKMWHGVFAPTIKHFVIPTKAVCLPVRPGRCTVWVWLAVVTCRLRGGCRKTAVVVLVVDRGTVVTAARWSAAAASRPSQGQRRRSTPGLWTFQRGRQWCRRRQHLPIEAACRRVRGGGRLRVASMTVHQDPAIDAPRHSCTAATTEPPVVYTQYASYMKLLYNNNKNSLLLQA